jgi:hypothetical protein
MVLDKQIVSHLKSIKPHLDIRGQWAIFPNTKTATQSISKGILNHRTIIGYKDTRNWEIIWNELFKDRLNEVFMWTLVRNPWDRVLSAFYHVRSRIEKDWRNFKFDYFVKNKLAKFGTSINSHFEKQHKTFSFEGKIMPFIFVGRFENLYTDWAYIANKIKIAEPLPHLNRTKHRHYTSYYNDETIRIVRQLYHTEIELLGYEFGK